MPKHILLAVIFSLIGLKSYAQEDSTFPFRTKTNAKKPGFYLPIINIDKTFIDPGDSIKVKIYFTGYGLIENSKICFTPSKDIFDSQQSYLLHDYKFTTENTGYKWQENFYQWGGIPIKPLNLRIGFCIGLTYVNNTMMYRDTYDTALHEFPCLINTEANIVYAPVEVTLVTLDHAPAGNYDINVNFTYFNGVQWNVANQIIHFTVKNWFQIHDDFVTGSSIAAALIAIIIGVNEFRKIIVSFLKWINDRKKTPVNPQPHPK